MSGLPWDKPRDNAVGREVAGALASFWKGGSGPSHSSISSAFALAGIDEPEFGNKEERVRVAVRNASDEQARRLVEELLDLLRTAGSFGDTNNPDVARLRGALQRIGAHLTDEGFVDWPPSADQRATEGRQKEPAAAPSPPVPTGPTPDVVVVEVHEVDLALLIEMLRRIPQAIRPLTVRRRSRAALPLDDEYDLQDVVETVLRLTHADVRPEERTPSSAGSSSQIDFLIKREKCSVEVKVTRPGRDERQIKPEVLVDINDYQGHPDVDTLVVVVYDLASTFRNPAGFETDLSGQHGTLSVHVVVAGWPAPPQP